MNNDIISLLGERVEKFTMRDSTSVTKETAERILGSILYCIKSDSNNTIKNSSLDKSLIKEENLDIRTAFYNGLLIKKEKIKKAKILCENIKREFCFIDNCYYKDIIWKGMDAFFKNYDVEFNPQYNVLTLDYPLYIEIENLSGIDLIYEYLKRFYIEERFLKKFEIHVIEEILRGYNDNFTNLVINICKIILRNAIICKILNKNIYELDVKEIDIDRIKKYIENNTQEEMVRLIDEKLKSLLKELSLEEEVFYTYFKLDIKEFVKELYLYKEQNLLNIVISLRKEYTFKEKEHFQDGDLIDDNILRKIINEIKECRFLYDKIEIIKRNIKSLRDLKELLNECFYENEFKYVFDMLSNEEINVMIKDIKEKKAFQEYLCEWEEAFLKYVKNKKEM
ncbi:MAG: DUF6179 domain-containing protein [Clostridium sp.]|nr:DUF6179 domain-containing protein [Clostridium sp.]MCI7443817.1 DUF6179 domain-containing protein [Clostridium sp.]